MDIIFTWDDIIDKTSLVLTPEKIESINLYQQRFNIPSGLNKTELKELQKETQKKIDEQLERCRILGPGNNLLADLEREDYVIKKKKILTILNLHKEFGTETLKKAKAYPIEHLIEFDRAGFAKCLWHDEKRGSLKWYPERNKAHCFGGCGDFDSLDIYMKINGVKLSIAIKNLS